MDKPETEVVECDLLIVGGGMAGCGAAYESAYWAQAKGLRVVLVEKAAVERSGAVAMAARPRSQRERECVFGRNS